MIFYVGTLTREGGEGILCCTLEDGTLRKNTVIPQIVDPNYVIRTRDGKRLFSVDSNRQDREMKGGVCEYAVSAAAPQLTGGFPSDGNAPCFLTLDERENYLYLANYGTGSVCVYPVTGGLGECLQFISHSGSGPHPTRQTSPHVHQVTFIPGTQYLAACDLGTDEIVVYRADADTGRLTWHSRTHLAGGPRHLAYASAQLAYLVHELSNEVTVLTIRDGVFTPVQTLSTLPEGYEDKNTASAIRVSADGSRVYASNRGHGSIAEYEVLGDGRLSFMRWIGAGSFPRDFVVLEDGSFLVADQKAGVRLISQSGRELAFLPEPGAVCIAL